MTTLAAVSANFTRDLEQNYALIASLADEARHRGVDFLTLPEAAIGGYLSSLGNHGDTVRTTARSLPPAIRLDGPEIARVQQIVGDLVVAIGFCELADDGHTRYNAAAVLDGSTVYGSYRKVHQPLGEGMSYSAGSGYGVFDTPIGRVGLQICYDKAFPEAARIMALRGAQVIASLSAWPAARTATAENLQDDRWTYRFNLFDTARALDNQVFWVASNQSGTFGSLRYVGNAKVVDPGGNILATTLLGSGMAVAEVDIDETFRTMRAGMFHLRDRRPDVYGPITEVGAGSDLAHA
ncbi:MULTISPECIES: carbon-nitrogen hydrolase family protein [Mycolicibacterium]|jgi:predicted amidohydrolase|uniref:Nitrilase/cyanide hydratase and apolipoprotein N-acyltransferase n=1 Tax=Mycolicibacterium vanbaalenii (strain DSM 7251 / JCM 13017 / BCRC 16820 / KCTC 9966 / NRRL B-24157 / PYR-1) TaxID=350058 RepID=A1T4F9_MYCVP|nr:MULTISPECIES: carbon-nitrogen hydrolase family protein [Mycolicibacterium]ABM12059.1 Nitrilase/cyanide hydratase and apolipoprotein N-acyltransferase [Mycolicibacterium vanbaalenii PYR-1]MCV7130692.1 carbon-nitrogen hydrolase family protein [Mycolicibacterium vanbaalenii PYR-1]QZT58000.1 carbon-nitrogen hydrolase family protein [Mycolicibacterium austroafricanum]UJL31074.1 carbon-nitrogen hydrolase family protein [Mycolicibacterium vanbaalenii]WND57905.1 carbon-nitrogen hydrolase family pro